MMVKSQMCAGMRWLVFGCYVLVAAARVVTMAWKTCSDATGCAKTQADLGRDFASIRSFGTSHVYLFCGYGVAANGSFAFIPNPPQRWGVPSICRQAAALIAATPDVSYSIMVEARLDFGPGLSSLVSDGDGGRRFGAEAAAVLATFPQPKARVPGAVADGVGLQLDFERGHNKSVPLPTAADFAAMVGSVASQVPAGVGVSVSMCPYLSDYGQLIASGATALNDMDLYHADSATGFEGKLQTSMARLGSSSRAAFAAGISLFPAQNGWENTTAGLSDRLSALQAAGISRVNVFCWPLLGFASAAPPALIHRWAQMLSAWVRS